MKKICVGVCCAVCLLLSLTSCGEHVYEPEVMHQYQTKIETMENVIGTVLDVTDKMLIIRTNAGLEYVFMLRGVNVEDDVKLANGQQVYVAYEMENDLLMTTFNSKKAQVKFIGVASNEVIEEENKKSTAEGVVVQAGWNYTTIRTRAGDEYTFATVNTVQTLSGGLYEGLWVRITFDGSAKKGEISNALVRNVQECTSLPDTYMISGYVTNLTDTKLTLKAYNGQEYVFACSDAEYATKYEVKKGSYVVLYYRGSMDASPYVIRVADNRATPLQTVYGTVVLLEDGGLVVSTADGRQLSLWPRTFQIKSEEPLKEGDLVRVQYKGLLIDETTKGITLQQIDRILCETENENSVYGTVITLSEKSIAIKTEENKTLVFRQMAGEKSIPKHLAQGNRVRVYYHGWLGDAENPDSTKHAQVTHASLACA